MLLGDIIIPPPGTGVLTGPAHSSGGATPTSVHVHPALLTGPGAEEGVHIAGSPAPLLQAVHTAPMSTPLPAFGPGGRVVAYELRYPDRFLVLSVRGVIHAHDGRKGIIAKVEGVERLSLLITVCVAAVWLDSVCWDSVGQEREPDVDGGRVFSRLLHHTLAQVVDGQRLALHESAQY